MSVSTCKNCSTRFEVDTSKRNWQHIKLCSDACRKVVAAERKRKKYQPKNVADMDCSHCGKRFTPVRTIGARQKYCDRECYLAAKRQKSHQQWAESRQERKCAHCNTEFLPRKFSGGKQIYCSKDCQVRAISKRHDGKYRRSGKYQQEFKVVRPVVLERDGACLICGSDERLHVHHWDNSGRTESCNNSLENLGTVCGDCHSALHKVTLAKIDGEWRVDGKIFEKVGLTGNVRINL